MEMKLQWLVRTHENKISGPFTADEVKARVLSRALALQDELCSSDGYWFFLHEAEELQTQLGVQYPPRAKDREATDTETQTETSGKGTSLPERTDPDFRRPENVQPLPLSQSPPPPLGWVAQGAAKANSGLSGATVAPPASSSQTVDSGPISAPESSPATNSDRKDSSVVDGRTEPSAAGFPWVAIVVAGAALAGAAFIFWSRSR